jgi:DNA repair protein RadB
MGGQVILGTVSIKKLGTGCDPLDDLLGGGLRSGEVLLVFGERGTGKTALIFQTMASAASRGLKSMMIYSEGHAPLQRLKEIAHPKWSTLSELMWIVEVKDFKEQDLLVENIERQMPPKADLLAIDSITACYRAALGKHEENISINKSLNRELALIKDLCRRTGLAVMMTSEVTVKMNGKGVQPVASSILTYWADRVLRLEKIHGELRKVVLVKPPPTREAIIKLAARGLIGTSEA